MISAPPVKQKSILPRKHLFEYEVEAMIKAANSCRAYKKHLAVRNQLMLLMAFRHGLRSSEIVNMRWQQIDLKEGFIYVSRCKGSRDSTHRLSGREMRMLRKVENGFPKYPFVFQSERKTQISTRSIRAIVADLGVKAEIDFAVNPHMLRHGCGFHLASKGEDTRAIQDYLGHKNIANTEIYTKLSPNRFDNFFND